MSMLKSMIALAMAGCAFLPMPEAAAGHYVFRETGEEYLRLMNDRAKNATKFSAKSHRKGDDDYTFTSKDGEDCTGFRRPGPSRSLGYEWVAMGVLCLPRDTRLDEARMFQFMDGARLT